MLVTGRSFLDSTDLYTNPMTVTLLSFSHANSTSSCNDTVLSKEKIIYLKIIDLRAVYRRKL